MALWNTSNAVSFCFPKFVDDQKDLIFQGGARSYASRLQLTKVDNRGKPENDSVGRVFYSAPLHLWENATRVASFETNFTFSILSASDTLGDGLAFFIAPFDSDFPQYSSGCNLGLYQSDVVAVEFDTYPNVAMGDPEYRHIGININNIVSKNTARWEWHNGTTVTAHISYNSASKRLTVVAFYPDTPSVILDHEIELNKVLPEWVKVGFSASTGGQTQENTIHSWSFTFNNSIG